MSVSVILVAGGIGSRMGSSVPKQFLPLGNKLIARHSFDVFKALSEVLEIIVVCEDEYRSHFDQKQCIFAKPGERRQDSVYSGLQYASSDYICVHDAARPFINIALVRRVIEAAQRHGAAAAGMPIKFTVKQTDAAGLVSKTLPREQIWEIQTPQVIRSDWLREGFAVAHQNQMTVTDDTSLAELLNRPVQLVEGGYYNLKITSPEDLIIAERLCPRITIN